MTGFFDMDEEEMGTSTGGFFDLGTNEFSAQNSQQAAATPFGRVMDLGGKIGTALQPFAAPQQVLFGGIGALEDLATGQGSTAAWDTFKQGTTAAGNYLTYQKGSALPGALGRQFEAPKFNPVLGYQLFKKVGAPDWLAKWGGLGADFFLDVPLVGKAAKLGSLGKLDNAALIVNAADSFTSPGAVQDFAAAILKAPFSTAPLQQVTAALPAGLRTGLGARVGDALENARWRTGVGDADAAGFTASELFVSRTGRVPGVPSVQPDRLKLGQSPGGTGLPDELIDLERRAKAVNWNIKFRLQDAGTQMEKVTKLIPPAYLDEWKLISTRLADTKSPGETALWDGRLRQLGTDIGNPNLYATATTALDRGLKADVYAATQLEGLGLMSAGELAAYTAGDKRHLRRIFGYYDNPVQHSERLERRGLGAAVDFDDVALTNAFQQAINRVTPTSGGSAAQYAQDLKAAWADPKVLPADAMTDLLKSKGWADQDVLDTITDIAGEWSAKAGIKYKGDDVLLARSLRKRAAEESGSQGATRAGLELAGNTGILSQRVNLEDYQRLALEEVQDYTRRATEQGEKVGKLVEVRSVVKGYENFLQKEGLVFDEVGPNSVQNTAGWRYVTQRDAVNLDTPSLSGKYIPAMFHRRLMETQTIRDPGVIGAAWQWVGSKWQQLKLANPGSIATNLASGFVMAERAGVKPLDLTRGIAEYSRLVRGANRGDGVLDDAYKVAGVSMREMMEHGEFLDATFTRAEVAGRLTSLERILLNPNGSPLQRTAAGLSEFLQGNTAAATVARGGLDVATLGARHIIAGLSNVYGQVDAVMKGGIYMASRRAGMTPKAAAARADHILFNYETVPYAIDYARRAGLLGIPFASFQLLSAGRFLKTLYENPYAVQRYYRIPQSATADMSEDDKARLQASKPDYVRNSLYVHAGRDQNGDARYFNLASILPESGVFDAFDADGVSRAVPPAVQLFAQFWSGKGYQGRDVYAGGDTYAETLRLNPEEAARASLKLAWQFGAVPWAPGQPMTERVAKSLAKEWVRAEDIGDPRVQGALKILTAGPVAPLEGPVAVQARGTKDPQPPVEAALRYLGIKTVPLQDTLSKPGSARQNLDSIQRDLQTLDQQMDRELSRFTLDPQTSKGIRQKYALKRAPLIRKLQAARSTF